MALTPEQKQQKKLRDSLKIVHNSVISDFQFKKIGTWHELYQKLGATVVDGKQWNEELLWPDLKQYLQKREQELEERIKGNEAQHNEIDTVKISSIQTQIKPIERTSELSTSKVEVSPSGNVDQSTNIAVAPTAPVIEAKFELISENDYGFIPSPKESRDFHAHWFQKKAITEITEKVKDGKRGILLISGTGSGKTFMAFGVLRRALDIEYHEDKTWSHNPYLFITKSTIVEQQQRVAKKFFNIDPVNDVEVINLEQLRSKAGQMWVKEIVKIVNGEEKSEWVWKKNIHPCIVFFDESQGAKNTDSTQSRIMCSYSDIPKDACLISISATPFARVCEAKCFAVSTKRPLDHLGVFPPGAVLNNETWPMYANIIASPAKPDEYVEAAIERLMEDLKDYVVRVKGIKTQFNAKNGVKIVPFETEEKRKFYLEAWTRFEKEMQRIADAAEAGDKLPGNCHLVVLQQFSMAAELCHAEGFADIMFRDVSQGKAACCAVKWKGTIIHIVKFLIEKYGVTRDQISLVWGGGQTQLNKKQKAKKKINEMDEKLKAMGMSSEEMLEDLDLDEVEDRVLLELPEHWRLGSQDKEDRQKEIDKFQSGKSHYCIYTFRAGGVGLSLHHSDELTTDWDRSHPKFPEWYEMIQKLPEKDRPSPGKTRRKESGYAFVEDIPFIPVRPRTNRVAVTYNAIELAQGLGRLPRLTSLSDSEQDMYCYEGTIEMDIGHVVSPKLRCLSSVVKMHEGWQDVIFTAANSRPSEKARKIQELIATTEKVRDDEQGTMLEDDLGEDEE